MRRVTFDEVEQILYSGLEFGCESDELREVEECYMFLKGFAAEKVIYGINTGFGPMAQWRVDDKYLQNLQYNIIRSHSTGVGEPLDDIYVKAAMVARTTNLMQARSGVHPSVVKLLTEFINRGIYPYIPQHGSVGASGDLVQLAHIALTLIGEGRVHYKGEWRSAKEVMDECGLEPLKIYIREGLSITNGTSVMTGIAAVNQHYAERLLELSVLAAVWMNEVAGSYDDWMAEELSSVRRQTGQQKMAQRMRELAADSQCLTKREHHLYSEEQRGKTYFEHKVQAYYSLRCTPQILGPVYDTLANSREVIENEFNSACDNPIVDPVAKNVFHGGNFHGDYISLEEDKVKIAVTRLAMTAERQMNYLFHDRINGILPPFLNMGTLGLNYGMQACQFTATSTTAECQTLSTPNYVHSIPNNNDNQDIVSMGTNSALLCKRVIDNAYQVMAIHMIALRQATDILKLRDRLCTASREMYDRVNAIIPAFVEDKTFYGEIAEVEEMLKGCKM